VRPIRVHDRFNKAYFALNFNGQRLVYKEKTLKKIVFVPKKLSGKPSTVLRISSFLIVIPDRASHKDYHVGGE